MTPKQRRLTPIASAMGVLPLATGLVLNGLRESIVFFTTPTMLAQKPVRPGSRLRLGAIVQPGSLDRSDGLIACRRQTFLARLHAGFGLAQAEVAGEYLHAMGIALLLERKFRDLLLLDGLRNAPLYASVDGCLVQDHRRDEENADERTPTSLVEMRKRARICDMMFFDRME